MVEPQAGSLRSVTKQQRTQRSCFKETVKYKSYSKDTDTLLVAKWSPSQLVADLTQPTIHAGNYRAKPQIIELLNIAERSHQVESAVPIDQPIFQPYPPEVVFHSYEPLKHYDTTLRLRNNDKVARRVSVEALDSRVFQVQRVPAPGQAVGSKIAAGMEAVFKVTFLPESIDSYEQQLVVVTEREKFLVPLLAIGAAAALDLPDSITLPAVAAKKTSRQSLLVTNVGRQAGSFQLATSSSCFTVAPSKGMLAPGETLQLTLEFTPSAAGEHEGELEVSYDDSSRTTFTALKGLGLALDVGMSSSQIHFLPTCMGKLSQRCFKVFNNSNTTVSFSIRAQPSAQAETEAACTALVTLQQQTSLSGTGIAAVRGLSSISGFGSLGRPERSNSRNQQQQQRDVYAGVDVEMELADESSWEQQQQQAWCSTSSSANSEADQCLLEDAQLAALRRSKRARRDITSDKQLFGTPHFAAFPPEGSVYPHSEQEVVLQFSPDCADQFEAVAWLELQGVSERLPVQLFGQGVGAQVVFSYDTVDIGEAFVNTEHQYEVELLNRGKVEADWVLQPCHTKFGSKFSFAPSSGVLQPGASQTIGVKLLSDILGHFDETFQMFLKGDSKPVTLNIKGAVVGPQFSVDTQTLDYGIMSYGFRYTKELLVTNTGAIPLSFHWHLAEETTPVGKDFTIIPAKGTVLPYAKQKIQVEFQPQSMQRYALSLVMDIPNVADAAAQIPIQGESAVPLISLLGGDDLLQFGQVFLRYPYRRSFTLMNDSKLPAKVEVLPQDQPSQSLGTFVATPAAATIPAKGTCAIELSLEAARLGRLQLPVFVRVLGSRNKPLQVIADATAVGPSLMFAILPVSQPAAVLSAPVADNIVEVNQQTAAASTVDGISADAGGTAAAGIGAGEVAAAVPIGSSDGSSGLLAEASVASRAASTTSTSSKVRGAKRSAAGGKSRAAKPEPPQLEWTSAPTVNFGQVPVLKQHLRELRLRNTTLIDADVKLFIEGRDSVFEVEPREGVVPAGGELAVKVAVLLDDTAKFKDVLHALVTEGADISIPLEATGTGNTLVSDVLCRPQYDFGAQFVGRPWQMEVTISNMGRKAATLTWSNSKLLELNKTFSKTSKGSGKKFDLAEVPADQQPVFTVTPDKVQLDPRQTTNILISGISQRPGLISEQLQCLAVASGTTSSSSSSGSNKPAPVFDIALTADVAVPLLELSKRAVEFVYTHLRGATPQLMLKTVQAKNVSKLPVQFTLKATSPFNVEPAAVSLQPGDSASIDISFDPDFRHDLLSQVVKQRCLISYPDNPQKDWLELSGVIDFPNLQFDTTTVDFGCVLMDSMRRMSVALSNPGRVPVEYSWSWISQPTAEIQTGAESATSSKAPKLPPTQLFDILPIHGMLEPGQKEQVEFSFYAYPGVKATAIAACSVVDGPVYQFQLSGESNSIKFDVSPQFFDCGLQPYDRLIERDLVVNNTGKVAFDFNIDLSQLSRPGIIEASPTGGQVLAGDKAKVKLKVKAGVPSRMMELVLVQVAHFEPVQVQVLVEGTYPMLTFNLPRIKDDAFLEALQQAQTSAGEQVLAATMTNSLDPSIPANILAKNTSMKSPGRQSTAALQSKAATTAFAGVPRGTGGPGSVAGQSIAGTAISGNTVKTGRPGSGAKSVASGVSARSRATSATTAVSIGEMMAKDKLAQLLASLPAEKRLDNEAERLQLVQQLLNNNKRSSSDSSKCSTRRSSFKTSQGVSSESSQPTALGIATAAIGPTAQASATTTDVASTLAGGARRPPAQPKLPELVSGHYLLDFGSVIKGINKSKKVKMTNMSSQLVSFVVDKQTLESFGFSMVPEAAIKLAGAPECQSTEVTFTVLSAKARVQPGALELTLPMQLKGGPAVLLTLRALVVVPEVVPNESVLDFGTVSTGHCKVYTVQLHNPREVPAEWSIKRPAVDSPKLKDWGLFVPEPSEGVLEPGARANVRITFTPTLNRDVPYSLALPIKVSNNPKVRELVCGGKGYTPRVDFGPKVVDCGAILPRFPGQKPNEATVQLTNTGDRPVEVICLDLDKQYQADEEALRSLDIYGESGVALLRPLAPGEPTWPELLEAAARHKQLEAAATEAAAATALQAIANAQAALSGTSRPDSSAAPARSSDPATSTTATGSATSSTNAATAAPVSGETVATPAGGTETAAEVGELELVQSNGSVVQRPRRLVIILCGSPLSGTSAQAAALCSRYGIPCVTIDGLLKEALHSSVSASLSEAADSLTASASNGAPWREQLGKMLTSPLLGPIAEATTPSQLINTAVKSSTVTPPTGQLTVQETHQIVVKALQLALSQSQYQAGFVLEGVGSKHLPHAAFAVRCMLQAVGLVNKALLPAEDVAASGRIGSPTNAGKAVRRTTGSRPSSSRSGIRASLVPEAPSPILDLNKPDVWEGPQQVYAVQLQLSKDEAARRFAAAVSATAEGLEAADMAASELLVEACFAEKSSAPTVKASSTAAHSPEKLQLEVSDAVNPAAATSVQPLQLDTAAFESKWAAYVQEAAALDVVLGGANLSSQPISNNLVDAQRTDAHVTRSVIGFKFNEGVVSSFLPAIPEDQLLVPPPYEMRVLAHPPKWPKRLPLTNFKIWTLPTPAAQENTAADGSGAAMPRAESQAVAGADTGSAGGKSKTAAEGALAASPRQKTPRAKSAATDKSSRPTSATSAQEDEAAKRGLQESSRWVIPAHGSVNLLVQFASDNVGKFSEVLGFDVVCGERNQKVVLTGACDYPHISTEARNVYYKIAKARPSTPQIKQQFILPNNVFEFGPVLAGRDKAATPEGHPDHTSKFRITNNGLFPLHAEFWLASEGEPAEAAAADTKKKAAPAPKPGVGGKAAAGPTGPVFTLQPSSMDLAIDETHELTVAAYPSAEGSFEDIIICRLRDNPTLFEFPISVVGAKPSAIIKVDIPAGAAPAELGKAVATGTQRRTSDVGVPKSGKQAANKNLKQPIVELTIQFDRLLLRKKDTQAFIISNNGVLPIKWRLAGADKLPPEFKVFPAAGELAARSDVRAVVEFTAFTKKDLSEIVTLEVLDVQESLGVCKAMPIAIKGEAHDIHVDIKFPQDSLAGVDFGPVRVVDDCVKQLVLKNTEKYDVQFEFAVKNERLKQLLTITPEFGVLPPNKDIPITMHWNKDKSLKQEMTFFGNTDILLSFIDPSKSSKEQQLPIKLSVRAQFSHYAITPARGLHFGPNTYNTLSKPRCFEVVNLGEFPFNLRVFDLYAEQNAQAAVLKALAEETAAKAAALANKPAGRKPSTPTTAASPTGASSTLPPPPPGALQIGQFTIDPAEAVVPPGARQEVSVIFRAEGNQSWSAVAALDISERDFVDQPEGIPYELGGESCIPGIDATNTGSMFEEHVVLSHLDPFNPINCSFGLRDKVFNFGTVIAQLAENEPSYGGSSDGSSSNGGDRSARRTAAGKAGSKGVAGNSRSSVSGSGAPASSAGRSSTAAAQSSGSLLDEPGAVKANLRFINPIKVPCTVNFSIKPRGGVQQGLRFPMEVFPSSIIIPPHEYRYVTLAFCPRAIQQYSATFEATVAGGQGDPRTAGFVCELKGEGTLPSLSIQEPTTVNAAGRPLLKFGRLLTGRSSRLQLNVRNNGLLPASARIEMDHHPAFVLLEGSQPFAVESKKAATFTVEFTPPEVGTYSHELQLRVKMNPYEQYKIAIAGECYQEDITFSGLPGDSLSTLSLPDVYLKPAAAVSTPSSARNMSRLSQTDTAQTLAAAAAAAQTALPTTSSYTFSMVNHSSNKHFRFKWPEHPQLKFTPCVGHIHAGACKDVTVTFSAASPVKLDGQEIKLAISQISYKGAAIDWDELIAASMIAAGVRGSSATRATGGLPGAGPKPGAEPVVDLVPKTQRDLVLKVYGTADTPRYECSAPAPAIVFRPTMMFQTRSFAFTVTNTALTALKFNWMVLDKQGVVDESGLYSLTPASGELSGGSSQQFTLRFNPQEVEDVSRTIMCHMPVLEQLAAGATAPAADALKQLTREVTGKVLRPWCHFELPDSDYLSAGRRNPEQPGPSGVVEPLDPATKVLEFDSLGVRVRNTKQFFILNPTSISYDFVWAPVLPAAVAALGGPPPANAFSCLVKKGTISGGRRYEMVFEFTPTSDTLVESFWTFSIPSQGICVPFLFVGHVSEPRLSLNTPAINFGQVQLGVRGKITFTLLNDEHLPFSFALDKASYDASDTLVAASGGKPLLDIQPATGTVGANSKIDLVATFAPQAERPINYNVVVRVRNKPTPLVLNVKGEGYALQPLMLLELPDGSLEMSTTGINMLDFGQVVINDRVVKSFSLVNSGRVNFDYAWDLGSNASLSVKPQAGCVPKGERRVVEMSYAPTTKEQLAGYKISCQITNGPKYQMTLNGSGYKPKLEFSFLNHDFGPCHVWQQGMTPSTAVLTVQNQDTQAVSFDVMFDNTETWQVVSSPCVLQPGQSQGIPITFKPSAVQDYHAVMPLRVNGLYNINIQLAGEGVPLHVELAKPEQLQRGVSFGAVPAGSSCSRAVSLVNRGKAAALVSFEPSAELFEWLHIEVTPAGGILLRPHDTADVTLWYRPKQRMLLFKEQLRILVAGVPQVLTTLTGAATGMCLILASDSIPFGTVVLGSRTTKRLQLSNTGDLGCKYQWDTKQLGQEFSISPAEGFLAPGQDVKLEVSFHPTTVNADIRVERLHCRLLTSTPVAESTAADVTGRSAASHDLMLTLTGACVESEAAGELSFKCNVRTSTSKSITLTNGTSSNWQLRPVISNEFWSGPEFLQVPAGGSASYTLVYKPLTMTSGEGQLHEGNVFFPIPDGSGLLYKLHGQSDQPMPEAVIELSLPAKTQHSQNLKVSNWLHKPQRFKVIKELLAGDASTRLEGAAAIDVPALCDRDYKMSVYSYTTGLTHARITFKNEASGEYTYYELKLTSSAPATVGQLVMECPCFSRTSTTVSITNPMAVPVQLKPSCTNKQISLCPDPPVLAPNSTTPLEVRFRPLLVGTSDAVLRLDSPELGLYEWKLKLTGAPTNPGRSIGFNVPLGTRDTQVVRFTHWLPEKVDYKCSFKHSGITTSGGTVMSSSGFDAPATVSAPPAGPNGVEVECVVGFEPSNIGEVFRDVLVLSSAAAGPYEFPLMGQCVPPKPQGPIDVSKGSASVPFRNVFNAEAEFFYNVDNPAFTVGRASEKLAPKKPGSIAISYKPETAAKTASSAGGTDHHDAAPAAPAGHVSRTGQLTVSCPKHTSTQWVFYLQA